jgi:3-oxoadipate enol-lactonase
MDDIKSPGISESRMKITTNRISFNCSIDGKADGPWIVFSNSLAANLNQWNAQVAALEDRFRILRYDQRGHGGTEALDGAYTFDQLTDDALALMDAFKIERTLFIGVSMGGVTGLRLAGRYPDRMDRVVASGAPWEASPDMIATWEERIGIVRQQGMEPMVESTIRRWFRPDFVERNPPVLDTIRHMIRETPPAGYIGCARALQNFNFRDEFSKIRVPALLVTGANDGTLPAMMREMHNSIAGSKYIEIPDVGHLPNVEKPEAFNRALADFFS